MTLRLSGPPGAYSQADQAKLRAELTAEDRLAYKRGEDVEISQGRLILTEATTGTRYSITVSPLGALVATALP